MFYCPNTMRYLCSLLGASADDLVTAETPTGFVSIIINFDVSLKIQYNC